ncbi:hypothetical protein [Microbacterium sp. NPDC089188]|uniref:hypothetical protein n=1 Tax=Microbacterium sp. NPDC089188 TaxID=3154971 RepID=UPI003426A9A3
MTHTEALEPGYHPPAFPLYEAVFRAGGAPPRRWLSGWNGPVTAPATDVTLAAKTERDSALVASSRWNEVAEARATGALLLSAFRVFAPATPVDEVLRLAEDDTRWNAATVVVDGRPFPAVATAVEGVTITCCVDRAADVHVAVASIGEFSLRRLIAGRNEVYPADPFVAHAYADLPPVDDIVD